MSLETRFSSPDRPTNDLLTTAKVEMLGPPVTRTPLAAHAEGSTFTFQSQARMTDVKDLKIACIGWGSLVWDPRSLSYHGDWNTDGPLLPVEFARESDGSKITLVICPDVPRVSTRWVHLKATTMEAAKRNLGLREYAKAGPRWIAEKIGYWAREGDARSGSEAETIATWAKAQKLDGVVWTDLNFGFKASPGSMPSGEQIVAYLSALSDNEREEAERYVRRAPIEVDTPNRRLIAQALDWR
jgi:hypothetical protein